MTAKEKEKKPMLDLDALEVGFYAKGQDGNFYKVDLPVDFSFTKTINVLTGEVHYQNKYAQIKSMSIEEMAKFLHDFAMCEDTSLVWIEEWLKEEVE